MVVVSVPEKLFHKWIGFKRIVVPGKKHPTAQCEYCLKLIQSAQPARHLIQHASECSSFPKERYQALGRAIFGTGPGDGAIATRGRVSPDSSCSTSKCSCSCMCGARPDKALNVQVVLLALTAFIICSGSSFRIVENQQFRAFIQLLYPLFPFPSRKRLAGSLSRQLYEKEMTSIIKLLKKIPFVTIVTDGWSNPNHESIVNFIITAPSIKPIFWKSVCTGTHEHTADYMYEMLLSVIEEVEKEIGERKVIGVLTDNVGTMLKVHKMIQAKRPWIIANGCAAHATDLIVQRILEFSFCKTILDKVVRLSKFIRNRHGLIATFRLIQKSTDAVHRFALKLPVRTRWYSAEGSIRGVASNKETIESLFRREQLLKRYSRTKDNKEKLLEATTTVDDPSFWESAGKLLEFLAPINLMLASFERDDCCISMVYELYKELVKNPVFNQALVLQHSVAPLFRRVRDAANGAILSVQQIVVDGPPAPKRKKTRKGQGRAATGEEDDMLEEVVGLQDVIRDEIEEKWTFLHTSAMGVAFLLDHTKSTRDFVGNDYYDARRFAFTYAKRAELLNGATREEFIREIKTFVKMKEAWTEGEREEFYADSPFEWWDRHEEFVLLRAVALRVFSVCTSSAASERSSSIFRFLHSDARNKLKPATVDTMVFIYTNYGRDDAIRSHDVFYLVNPGAVEADDGDELESITNNGISPSAAVTPIVGSQSVPYSHSQRVDQPYTDELAQRLSFASSVDSVDLGVSPPPDQASGSESA